MPYIACPACSERIDISKISFAVEDEAQLCDVMESYDKDIWCPHCEEKYTISIYLNFSDRLNISNEYHAYRDVLDIIWSLGVDRDREGDIALEYYDEEEEKELEEDF